MNAEFIEALGAIEKERGIPKEILLAAIEDALVSAYRRNFSPRQNVAVQMDGNTGEVHVFAMKDIVPDDELEDDATQMTLTEAQGIERAYRAGDVYRYEVTPRDFGRIAAQTAKQVVVQRLREAERGMIYDEYSEKKDEIVQALVVRSEDKNIYVEIGKAEGVLAQNETIPGETFMPGDKIRVYVLDVKNTRRDTRIIVSRSHPGFVKRLFEIEVPEIRSGAVVIKGITREAGYRTKIAVYSTLRDIDPVGACVGQKGSRVEKIVSDLHGEKIDIIRYSLDPAEYISNALSPAKVLIVHINEEEKTARVIVPDNQLSLAIGREGQNARLAARLTGWKIDIKSQSQSGMFDE